MRKFLRQTWAIARRDLTIEGRAGEISSVILPFAAVAVFVVPLATNTLAVDLGTLASPVYWLVGLLFGMQVSLRQTATESLTQRRQLVLLGVDPAARIAGRSLSATILTLAVLLVTGPLVILFYDPEPVEGLWRMVPVLALFSLGLSVLATLIGDITVGLRARSVLAPLIVAPLSLPLVVGASRALDAMSQSESPLTGTLLLVIAVLVLLATVAVAAHPLEEAGT